jgi:hypothetical protein
MQPNDVFFAVVCDGPDNCKPKKASYPYRRTFEKFVYFCTKDSIEVGECPSIFYSWSEAEEALKTAKAALTMSNWKGYQFWLETFRLTESDWNFHVLEDEVCRSRDARRMASGMLHYDTIAQQVKKLAGKVLTVIDAAYINEGQNKAVKDLTKNSFRSQLSELYNKAFEDADCDSCEGTNQKDILDD